MIEFGALRSRFGRRLLLLFVGLALIPILALAWISHGSMTRELSRRAEERLRDLTKSQAMSVMERLALLEEQLDVVSMPVPLAEAGAYSPDLERSLALRFRALTRVGDRFERAIWGAPLERPALSIDQRMHLLRGGTLLVIDGDDSSPRVLVARSQMSADGSSEEIWGEVHGSYLWWGSYRENQLPPLTELCLLHGNSRRTLFCSSGEAASVSDESIAAMTVNALGSFTWSRGGEQHRAQFRNLDIEALYGLPSVTVIVSEARAKSDAPLRDFRLSFLPIVLVTLWVVLLLSIRQIRRHLEPLEELTMGTRRIAAGNFEARVSVSSGDELEVLADSFNGMASQLGRQFTSLSALTRIQRSILLAQDRREIAEAVLTRLQQVLPHAHCLLMVLRQDSAGATIYSGEGATAVRSESASVETEDLWWLRESSEPRVVGPSDHLPAVLTPLRSADGNLVVAPVVLESQIIGVLAARLEAGVILDDGELGPVAQLADQIALALSKMSLIEELKALSVGTLSALGRTIDANSHWTLGHSERVTALSLRLGVALGLSSGELDTLERGALLHDIGKLGVPTSILDKPSRLTAEETKQVRAHVRIGTQILKPVPSLADTIPLVEQHHEWFDGGGYLQGLAGEEIHPLARLLSVVDCYDALRSPRPYRGAVAEGEVRAHLREQAGTQFDPAIVEAFLALLDDLDAERLAESPEREHALGM